MTDFSRRLETPELMDLPGCDPTELRRTYRLFRLTNLLFSDARRLVRRIFFPIMLADASRTWSMLDVGAGGGDFARWFVQAAKCRGIKVTVTAVECDNRVLPWLKEWSSDCPEISVLAGGTADDLAGTAQHDFVFSNHVLHHVPGTDIGRFVANCASASRYAMALTDLRRSRAAWLAYAAFAAVFLRGSFLREDGLKSILRAYVPHELDPVAEACGAEVVKGFPFRLAIVLRRYGG